LSFAERSFRAIGTTASVVVIDPHVADAAVALLQAEVVAIDDACSWFRTDSELAELHRHAGRPMRVSPLLFSALRTAYDVAAKTRGAVDPTVGNAVVALGFEGDFSKIGHPGGSLPQIETPVVGYQRLELNDRERTVRIPKGVRLDLGASAKAFLVDRAAARISEDLGVAVLVNVGGDIAVAGPPPPLGWPVGIAIDSSTKADDVDQVVAIRHGGLASSSTAIRTWRIGTERVHHIVDPRTGRSVPPYWTLVSACAASCVEANMVSTAAIVWGPDALEHLGALDHAVRLVRHDGAVVLRGGWPKASSR